MPRQHSQLYTRDATVDDEGIARMALAAAETPGAAFLTLDARDGGRMAALLVGPRPVLCVDARDVGGAVDALGDALDALPRDGPASLPVAAVLLGYDAAWRAASPRPVYDARPRGDACPAAWLCRYDAVHAVDLATGAVRRHGDDARLNAALARATAPDTPSWHFVSDTDRDAHLAGVAHVREAIRDGEVYLVNLARMLRCDDVVTPAQVAARVVRSGARYGAVLHADDVLVGAMSMELGLAWQRADGIARTRPIKGTRPRRPSPEDDALEAAALALDPKERAENAMAVDVHRNDLGRVADVGSVVVPSRFEVEAHRYVHHLVSTVEARVPGTTPGRALLRAMLPVGSVTGAPKLAAMEHIARFERTRRGLYTGVYGAVFGDGAWQLAVAIRTLVRDAEALHYGVGGGIVWDSDPAREWEELSWKLRAVEGR